MLCCASSVAGSRIDHMRKYNKPIPIDKSHYPQRGNHRAPGVCGLMVLGALTVPSLGIMWFLNGYESLLLFHSPWEQGQWVLRNCTNAYAPCHHWCWHWSWVNKRYVAATGTSKAETSLTWRRFLYWIQWHHFWDYIRDVGVRLLSPTLKRYERSAKRCNTPHIIDQISWRWTDRISNSIDILGIATKRYHSTS